MAHGRVTPPKTTAGRSGARGRHGVIRPARVTTRLGGLIAVVGTALVLTASVPCGGLLDLACHEMPNGRGSSQIMDCASGSTFMLSCCPLPARPKRILATGDSVSGSGSPVLAPTITVPAVHPGESHPALGVRLNPPRALTHPLFLLDGAFRI